MRKYAAFALLVLISLVVAPVRHSGAEKVIEGDAGEKQPSYSIQTIKISDNGCDADNFLWGTEVYPSYIQTIAKMVLKDTLPMRYLKIRIEVNTYSSKDGKVFSPEVCMPSPSNCIQKYNMDAVAALFKENAWSMTPMIMNNHTEHVTSEDIDKYVNFVDWFVSRYKTSADIRYLELINAPAQDWNGTGEQLAGLQNRVYERIKGKFPDILVGTPGFEYWVGAAYREKSVQEMEYFLDKRNNVKFDYVAIHGYPDWYVSSVPGQYIAYPPTKRAVGNKYAGPVGILEIRKKLDSNGWADRMIIDTEHVNFSPRPRLTPSISDEEDRIDAAYTIQELLIKRTLKYGNRCALAGIIVLNVIPRGNERVFLFGSLKPDGSLTMTVRAVGLLVSKLKGYRYSSHISGEFDEEDRPWIEKYQSGNKELYIFFKPFKYRDGKGLTHDGETVNYTLSLSKKPLSIVLTGLDGSIKYPAPNLSIALEAVNSPQFLEITYE